MFCQLAQCKKRGIVYLIFIYINAPEKQTKATSPLPPNKQTSKQTNKKQKTKRTNKPKKGTLFLIRKKKNLQDSFIIQVRRCWYASNIIVAIHKTIYIFFSSYITTNIHKDSCLHTKGQ